MTPMDLPDETMVSMKFVRQWFVPKDGGVRDMTTPELAREFGHSSDWWQDRARRGLIPGSYQGGERARWYIPREAATVFLREMRTKRRKRNVRPWKGPKQATQSG